MRNAITFYRIFYEEISLELLALALISCFLVLYEYVILVVLFRPQREDEDLEQPSIKAVGI